jgi:iron complex transport system permease protein
VLLACTALLLVSMILGIAVGSVPLSPRAVMQVIADHLAGHPRSTVADAIVWEIRLPRVLLAALVGATLATAGTVVQVLVRNALADPFLLGVSSGASVGATCVLLFGAFASLGAWAISAGSVLGAVAAMGAVLLVSRQGRALSPTQLILCGVVLSALFVAECWRRPEGGAARAGTRHGRDDDGLVRSPGGRQLVAGCPARREHLGDI